MNKLNVNKKRSLSSKIVGYVCVTLLLILVVGCSSVNERVNEAIVADKEVASKNDDSKKQEKEVKEENVEKEDTTESADANTEIGNVDMADIKAQAKIEGVSVKEMTAIIDGLNELGAEKYGVTKEAYISQIESSGNTTLSEWQVASDFMGISIKELYEAEKQNMATMSEESKDTLKALNSAVEEAKEIDLDIELDKMSENLENILGQQGDGEIRELEGDFNELFSYKQDEILSEYKDEYSIVIEYNSKLETKMMVEYYEELLIGTQGYTKLSDPESEDAMFMGTLNGMSVYAEVLADPNGSYVNSYIDLSSEKK